MSAPQVSQLPAYPTRTEQQANFDELADAHVAALPGFVDEINQVSNFVNDNSAGIEVAKAAAKYQGDYNPSTPYATGQSVSYQGRRYVSKVDENTGNTPDLSPVQWESLTLPGQLITRADFDANAAANRDRYASSGELNIADYADAFTFGSTANTFTVNAAVHYINGWRINAASRAVEVPGPLATAQGTVQYGIVRKAKEFAVADADDYYPGGDLAATPETWSALSDAAKTSRLNDPDDLLLVDDGAIIQVRWQYEVVTLADQFYDADDSVADFMTDSALGYTLNADNTWSDGTWFATPVGIINMGNTGLFHPWLNRNGHALASDGNEWWNTATSFTTEADTVNAAKLLAGSGVIGGSSGRPGGRLANQIYEIDDRREGCNGINDFGRELEREFRKLVAGEQRGYEGYRHIVEDVTATPTAKATNADGIRVVFPEGSFISDSIDDPGLVFSSPTAFSVDGLANGVLIDAAGTPFKIAGALQNSTIDDRLILDHVHGTDPAVVDITGPCRVIILDKEDHKAETLLHVDIIGDPANYPWAATDEVYGSPLVVAEDGTSLLPADVPLSSGRKEFKLSRKFTNVLDILAVYYYDASAGTYSLLQFGSADGQVSRDVTSNQIFLNGDWSTGQFRDDDIFLVFYETKANPLEIADNSEVLALGDVFCTHNPTAEYGVNLCQGLTGKIPTIPTAPNASFAGKPTDYLTDFPEFELTPTNNFAPTHGVLSLTAVDCPAVKTLSYLSRENGKAYLHLLFKELIFDVDYGDTGDFTVVDNISTDLDDNGNRVLVGTKHIELQQYIRDVE